MAINKTNSIYVSIKNLPKAQIALDPDLLVLETQNGTQTIPFQNFNVVKTDIDGNATVTGYLSGGVTYFNKVNSQTISADAYYTQGKLGTNQALDYYNRFEFTNGVVTSATYTTNSPEYNSILNTIRTLSATQDTIYKRVFERTGSATIAPGASAYLNGYVPIAEEFIRTGISNYHFSIMPTNKCNTVPVVENVSFDSSNVYFNINLYEVQSNYVYLTWRLLYLY